MKRHGRVYFIETNDGRFVKVGFTTNLALRVQQVRQDSRRLHECDAHLIASIDGTFQLERLLHERLEPFRHQLEWYHNTPDCRQELGISEQLAQRRAYEDFHRDTLDDSRLAARQQSDVSLELSLADFDTLLACLDVAATSCLSDIGTSKLVTLGKSLRAQRPSAIKPKPQRIQTSESPESYTLVRNRCAQSGGFARAKALTPQVRSESARKAARARWRKPKDA